MLKHMCCIAALAGLAAPAIAQDSASSWSVQTVRGLSSHTLTSAKGTVTLTCDPDRVYGDSSNATLVVQFSDAGPAGRLVVLASGGQQAAFEPEHGIVSQYKADADQWKLMVEILGTGGSFAFVTSSQALQFEKIDAISDLECE